MSGESRRAEAPQGPPWSLDLLADLHAGVLDGPTADELRRQVEADPEAREIMAALDATSTDLADLPPLTIPDDVSARIDAALQDEVRNWGHTPQQEPAQPAPAAGEAQVVDFAAAKARRRRRTTIGAGLVGVAAAAAAVIVAVLPGTGEDSNTAQPPVPSTQPSGGQGAPLALSGDQVTLDGQQFSQVMSSDQYISALADPQQLIGCLQANGVRGGKPMGAREITLDGQPGQLLILPGGGIGKFRLLAVGPDCGKGHPSTISDSTFGGG